LLLILLLALAVRLGWGLSRSSDRAVIEQLPDQREYLELADNLLHGRGLHFFDPRFGGEVYAYRTPGYPVFLAACGGSARVARMMQALIDTSTVLAMYLLARRWLPAGQSLWAAAIVAVNPFLVYFSGLILSETLFTAMLAWGMVLLVRPSPLAAGWFQSNMLCGGLILALAALVRPSGIGLPVLLGIGTGFLNRPKAGTYRVRSLGLGISMLLLTGAVFAPWAYRNHRVLGRWIWTTTNAGITAYDGFNDQATGASDQRFAVHLAGISRMNEMGRNDFFAAQASQWGRSHSLQAIQLALSKILRTWSPVPLSAEFGRPLYRWIGGLYGLPLGLLTILGLYFGRMPRGTKVFLLIPAIYITAIHAMSVGSLRYRVPAEPMLAVLGCQLLVATKLRFVRSGDSAIDPKSF
jgi:4-amino-4-deoxy-L-arabinose transferase-like glycosyltransferase